MKLKSPFAVDFLQDIPEGVLDGIPLRISHKQQEAFRAVLRAVPYGVVILLRAGGTGKSTSVCLLILLLLAKGETIGVIRPTNVAATNLITRLCEIAVEKYAHHSVLARAVGRSCCHAI